MAEMSYITLLMRYSACLNVVYFACFLTFLSAVAGAFQLGLHVGKKARASGP